MKKRLYQLLFFACIGSSVMLTSCDDNDEITPVDPIDNETILVEADEADGSVTQSADVSATATDQTVRVHFTSTDGNMRRLYILRNVNGEGDEPFELEDYIEDLDTKGDGSIDIAASESNEITYQFDLPVPPSGTGTVVYTFWATSARGDYRDIQNDLVVGPATLTLNYGGTNSQALVKSFTAKLLEAPLASGASETFLSLLDGEVYQINQGEEYVDLWDFGYFYGASLRASLASTYNYPRNIINIENVASVSQEETNHTYFTMSNRTSAEFDAVSVSSDLDFIATPSTERVTDLSVGDIVQFVDGYGKKGLIRVAELQAGDGSDDYITIEIKVQP